MATSNDTAALVIEHIVKKSEEKRYEDWVRSVLPALRRSSGYLGREVFPPATEGKPYTIIDRFASHADLQRWLDSKERRAFVESMQDAFEAGDQTTARAGIDVWFPAGKAAQKPAAHKQFLLTAAVIYPLSLVVTSLLSPLSESAPVLKNPFVGGLIVTVVLCAMMTYLIMPFLNRRLQNWLLPTRHD